MSGIKIRQIQTATSEYEAELKLRDDVMRRPLGLSIYDDDLQAEADDIHIGAFSPDGLVGVLVLTPLTNGSMKMRQVAVSEGSRKQGIGTLLVDYAERIAVQRGCPYIKLHARITAVAFYERLGYKITGGEFLEIGIPHRPMEKTIK